LYYIIDQFFLICKFFGNVANREPYLSNYLFVIRLLKGYIIELYPSTLLGMTDE